MNRQKLLDEINDVRARIDEVVAFPNTAPGSRRKLESAFNRLSKIMLTLMEDETPIYPLRRR